MEEYDEQLVKLRETTRNKILLGGPKALEIEVCVAHCSFVASCFFF